jgi:hypothetical protein
MGKNENSYGIMLGKPEGRRPLRRPMCRWEDNIKMNLKDCDGRAWTGFNWLRIGRRYV